ncbi:endonuclease III domain-containing protein [Candidatus Thiodiazotropha sp. CDECU1]|uniref:endonuclease III domain-containing protein n=1 Tax=Candidatus Thiodiazotropha sp. CDECU1 TaxID=3065865 RepID=UPI003FA445A5
MERQAGRNKTLALTLSTARLMAVYGRLFDRYGPQHWWPADTPFEVMVGAVLTQNTAWSNVEKAIHNLKAVEALKLESLLALPGDRLAMLIRPAGYYNIKRKRLQSLCRFLQQNPALEQLDTQALRERLLSVHGIGPETADDILLYAFERPVFVIDAYTRRLFGRLGWIADDCGYETLRGGFETALASDAALFNEYHALIVKHVKVHCSKRPLCDNCPLVELCAYPDDQLASGISAVKT